MLFLCFHCFFYYFLFLFVRLLIYLYLSSPLFRSYRLFILWFPACWLSVFTILSSPYSGIIDLSTLFLFFAYSGNALIYIDGSSIYSGTFVICSSSTQHFKLLCSLLIQVSSSFVSFNVLLYVLLRHLPRYLFIIKFRAR